MNLAPERAVLAESRWLGRLGLVAFTVAIALAFLVRLPSVAEPLGIDQGLWASVARCMSHGQVLYRDVWDHKPPGIFLTYLAAFSLLGWRPATVAWMDILAAAATTWLLFRLVKRAADATSARVVAALYATLTIPSWLFGYGGLLERSINETFILVCITFSALCADHARERAGLLPLLGLGHAGGAAIVFKPNAAVYLVALVTWAVLYGKRSADPRGVVRVVMIAGLGALAAPTIVAAWLWSQGVLYDGWVASVAYNLSYVDAQGSNHLLEFAKVVWRRLKTDPLWFAGALGSALALWQLVRTRRLEALPALAIAWGAASAAAIWANGAWLFSTYFVHALPPLAIMAGWLLVGIRRPLKLHRIAAWLAIPALLALLVVRHYPVRVVGFPKGDLDYLMGRIDRQTYLERFGGYGNDRGYSARANGELDRYIGARTRPDDRIYIFGISGTETYFAADRLVAQPLLRVNYFIPGLYPDPRFRLAAVIHDLALARPVYLVFEVQHMKKPLGVAVDNLLQDPNIVALLASYRLETRIEDFIVFRRAS
jgi:hypothetical protein